MSEKFMSAQQMRELDAWIAEHIMGYFPAKHEWYQKPESLFKNPPNGTKADDWVFEYKGGVKHPNGKEYCSTSVYDFKPTTDPASAMMVLEKCTEKTYLDIRINKEGKWFYCYTARITNAKEIAAKTLQLAICLLAKKLFTKD